MTNICISIAVDNEDDKTGVEYSDAIVDVVLATPITNDTEGVVHKLSLTLANAVAAKIRTEFKGAKVTVCH